MLEVQGLGSRYGRIPALADVALRVDAGELVAIVGANGAGKTTLLRTLSGVQPASAGTLRFDGADIGRASARQRVRMGIVQVPEAAPRRSTPCGRCSRCSRASAASRPACSRAGSSRCWRSAAR